MINVFRRKIVILFFVVFNMVVMVICFYHLRSRRGGGREEEVVLSRDYVLNQGPNQEPSNGAKMADKMRLQNFVKQNDNNMNIYSLQFSKTDIDQNGKYVFLKTPRGKTPIFVYPPEVDKMISSRLKDYGTWEEDLLNQTVRYFQKFPDMVFLDIGCNIGVYSLFIAKQGTRVVSIDGVLENIQMLSKSAILGNLDKNVTLLHNAISDSHRKVSMLLPKENIGGAYVEEIGPETNRRQTNAVDAIVLDDLTKLLNVGEDVFIKMDIEGHEASALKGGHDFFQTVNVRGILMEWMHHRQGESGRFIARLLVNNGLLPYRDIDKTVFLDPESYFSWPENVFWLKR